jgi:hypothetical protein
VYCLQQFKTWLSAAFQNYNALSENIKDIFYIASLHVGSEVVANCPSYKAYFEYFTCSDFG